MRAIRLCAPILALAVATPVLAQQADLGGPGTVVPGTGPGTNVHGTTPGPLMEAANAEDAAKRQNLNLSLQLCRNHMQQSETKNRGATNKKFDL